MVDQGAVTRLVLYSVAILYLIVDLFVINGPLRRAVFRRSPTSPDVIEAAKGQGVVARVYFQPIMLSQVERRVEENLWREGGSLEGAGRDERLARRRAALNELIDLHLLRLKVRFNQSEAQVGKDEIDAELNTFMRRFATEAEFQASLARMGWSEKELRYRIAARIQQEKYLASKIDLEVSEEEARTWFEENEDSLAVPERVRARHVFRSTLNADPGEVKGAMERLLEKLLDGKVSFAEAASSTSEDRRTADAGGELGWMQAERLPDRFAEAVFALQTGRPSLVRSDLGWHIVEVLERKPRTARTFEQARGEVMTALQAVKRSVGLRIYRQKLRNRDRRKIEIFPDVLERGLDQEKNSAGSTSSPN